MEIQFHQQEHHKKSNIPISKTRKLKGKNKATSSNNNNGNSKFVGVRQRPSGRWVAEIKDTTQKIRMWLGTFETAEQAARAYDEAACLLRGSNTRTNFVTHVSMDSPLASRIRDLLKNKKGSSAKHHQLQSHHDQQTVESVEVSTPPTSSIATNISFTTTTTTSSGSSVSEDHNSHLSEAVHDHARSFDDEDDAYKPDLSNCTEEFDMSSSRYDLSWNFEHGFNKFSFTQEVMEFPKDMFYDDQTSGEFSEFDRMKVERQISASLYAINGVQEYMDHTFYDPSEALVWDLPPLCS